MDMPSKIGESLRLEAHGKTAHVKRISASTWHLRLDGLTCRSRFGSKQEIREDVASFMDTGALPGGRVRCW